MLLQSPMLWASTENSGGSRGAQEWIKPTELEPRVPQSSLSHATMTQESPTG